MKKFRKFFGMFTALLVVLGGVSLVSCSSDDEGSDGSGPGTAYTLSVSEKEVTVAPSGVKKVTVTTNGVFTAESSNASVATAEASNSAKTVTITGMSTVTTKSTATITLKLNEDSTQTAIINVTVDPDAEVTADTYTLTLSLDEDVAKSADHITVYYGADSGTYETVDATYTAGEATATAELKKSLANSSGWFNHIVVTVYDSSNSKISTEIDGNNYFDSGTAGATMKISAYTAAEMTLTINFTGDEGAISKVSLLYYPAEGNTEDGKTETATVTNETVTFTLSKEYASGWGYNATITAYDSADNDITSKITALSSTDSTFGGDASKSWWAFVADSTTTVSATYSAETQVALATEKEVTVGTDNAYTQVLEASSFADLSIGTLIVTISSETSGAWASVSGASDWATDTYKSDAINTTVYITTATFINAVKTNGLYINSSAGTFTVTVKYIEGTPEDDTKEETSYTYTQIGSDVSYTATGSLVSIAESSSFSSIETIDAIKIEVTSISYSGTDSWWFTYGYGSEWDTALSWDSDISGYSLVISDSDKISSIKTSGLTLGANSGLTATVKVYYGVSE